MTIIDHLHDRFLMGRRARVLSERIAALLPEGSRVLDVGCGDGDIAQRVMELRTDVLIQGIDVLVRPQTAIPVTWFDGSRMPFGDSEFDCALLVDVLHHTVAPEELLREATRVTKGPVVIKDHLVSGPLDVATLRFMDRVGNERHGVGLPHTYLSKPEWESLFSQVGLKESFWEQRLGIYIWPATWLFDRKLHFLMSLTHANTKRSTHT